MPKVSTLLESSVDCEVLRQVRQDFADQIYFTTNDYICYVLPSGRAYEHRLVAERAYGELPPRCHIHHIDECKGNNSADNLKVVEQSYHHFIHLAKGHVIHCPVCDKKFWVKPSQEERYNTNCCSHTCARQLARRVERPSKEHLTTLLTETPNFLYLSRIYGVSDNAIRKWCRYYNLPTKTSDWRHIYSSPRRI